jgi:O-antigen ligase
MNLKIRNFLGILSRVIETVVLLDAFFIVNLHSFVGSKQFPDVALFTGNGWIVIPSIVIAFLLVVAFIKIKGIVGTYFDIWKKNPFLLFFLAISVLSLIWSVYFPATLYKLLFLLFASAVGSYISIRFGLKGSIEVLTWAAVLGVTLSLLAIVFLPNATMYNPPYTGSWRGIFWHRNHMGDIMAYFNAIFLFRLVNFSGRPLRAKIFEIVYYFLSLVLVFGSRSATGIIVLFALHSFVVLCYAWLKWHPRLKSRHYYLITGVLATAAIIVFTNLGFFFGLLGRSANMTGRVPLWQDLLSNIWTQKPWLGYGYGALWMQQSFRYLMMERQNWNLFPVFFADNGFLDILLNLGLVGFIPFALLLISRWIQSIYIAITSKHWIDIFLPLTFTYVFVGNLAYSFLLEVDQFVWTLFIIAVFLTSSYKHPAATT